MATGPIAPTRSTNVITHQLARAVARLGERGDGADVEEGEVEGTGHRGHCRLRGHSCDRSAATALALAAAACNGSDCCNGRDVEEVDGERVDHLKVGGSGVCDGKRAGRCIRVSPAFEWASGEIAACDQFGKEAASARRRRRKRRR